MTKWCRKWATLAAAAAACFAIPALAQSPKPPDEALKALHVAPGLQITTWATEPQLFKPTNMDIDARGRIWVTEGANYRGSRTRAEGDRIVILEDTQHTGKCDNYKVFVQDAALKSPLGICVLGDKVIVAQSPNMLIYTIDESGDRPKGPPQVIFTGFGGVDHDHGVHSGIFGPDGRYYFNCGNEGDHGDLLKYGNYVKGKDGQPVTDILGSEIGRRASKIRGKEAPKGETAYREGLAMAMNLEATELEVLGYNFRNNYELAVDSFGNVWQTDNDDDGNQGVAINYVMEGGNFGFTGPKGSSWGRDMQTYANIFKGQTKQEAHWHQRWPGVVPNLLNTGQGSPCGMIVYEGDLLPELYRGALLHCDAGPNVVRAYITKFGTLRPAGIAKPVSAGEATKWKNEAEGNGGGYEAKEVEIVEAHQAQDRGDRWFRPDDICVAPDGSIFITDWYDPGVGGHQTADTGTKQMGGWTKLHGRVYRLTPQGYNSGAMPAMDLSSVKGQIDALNSPNLARRYFGYTKLAEAIKANNAEALNALKLQFTGDKNPRLRARALWLLGRNVEGNMAVQLAIKDKDPDIRITGIRVARQMKSNMVALANQMLGDSSTAVLRELCLAMQFVPTEQAMPIILKLADKYDGKDRWYLEAWGIACNGREKEVLATYEKDHKSDDLKSKNIAWRLKLEPVQPSDAEQANATPVDQALTNWWALGPFAVEGGAAALHTAFDPEKSAAFIDTKTTYPGSENKTIQWEKPAAPGRGFGRGMRNLDVARLAAARGIPTNNIVGCYATALTADKDQQVQLSLGAADDCTVFLNGKSVLIMPAARPLSVKENAATLDLKKGRNLLVLQIHHTEGQGGVTAGIYGPASIVINDDIAAPDFSSAMPAASTIPSPSSEKQFKSKDGKVLPPMPELARLTGNAQNGEKVFKSTTGANCIKCHQIGDEGQMIGPPLNAIGNKLSKAQLYDAILFPSAVIEMGYETWVVRNKAGEVFSGLKVEDTPDHITIKDTDAKFHDVPVDQIDRQVKQPISLMPEGLSETMTWQELVDLVEFLTARKG